MKHCNSSKAVSLCPCFYIFSHVVFKNRRRYDVSVYLCTLESQSVTALWEVNTKNIYTSRARSFGTWDKDNNNFGIMFGINFISCLVWSIS